MLQFFKMAAPGAACLFSIISCLCWARSASAKVKYSVEYYAREGGGSTQVEWDDQGRRVDLNRTAELRGKWNTAAAAAASCAAFFQALTLALGG